MATNHPIDQYHKDHCDVIDQYAALRKARSMQWQALSKRELINLLTAYSDAEIRQRLDRDLATLRCLHDVEETQ